MLHYQVHVLMTERQILIQNGKRLSLPSRSCNMAWQAWGPPNKAVLAERRIECWGGERRRCLEIKAARQIRVMFRVPLELVSNNHRRTKPLDSDNLQDRRTSPGPFCGSLTRFSWTDTQVVSVMDRSSWLLLFDRGFVMNDELCWLEDWHIAMGGKKRKIYKFRRFKFAVQ